MQMMFVAVKPVFPNPHVVLEVGPNFFDKGACFYLMLGFTRPMIDTGLFEAAALIVFKTTYLSYECFIQETKCELAEWEPHEHWGIERLMHANNGLREGWRRERGQ